MNIFSNYLYARPSLIEGFARIIDAGFTLQEYNVLFRPEQAEYLALLSDWLTIGDDLKNVMAEYKEIPSQMLQPDIDIANELIDMAKKQSQHRREMENVVIRGDNRRSLIGLIFGFVITLVSIGTGAFLIYTGHDIAGIIFAGTPIISIVTAFIYGTKERSKERMEKQKALGGEKEAKEVAG